MASEGQSRSVLGLNMIANIRLFEPEDAEATARIFYETVHLGTRDFYDDAQRRAWAKKIPETAAWHDRLQSQTTFVALIGSRPVGFMAIDADGHIDLVFVAPDVIGRGVAKALYDHVEAEALRLGLDRLDTAASHLARPFFERQGWIVVQEQAVKRGDVSLTNFVMEKYLIGDAGSSHRIGQSQIFSEREI